MSVNWDKKSIKIKELKSMGPPAVIIDLDGAQQIPHNIRDVNEMDIFSDLACLLI